jgi:hypothetical protein
LGFGVLGIGDGPKPKAPIPNPQSPSRIKYIIHIFNKFIKKR